MKKISTKPIQILRTVAVSTVMTALPLLILIFDLVPHILKVIAVGLSLLCFIIGGVKIAYLFTEFNEEVKLNNEKV